MKKNQLKVKNQQEISIGSRIRLFMADIEILKSPTVWLSDSVIYAASALLAQQAKDIDGWQAAASLAYQMAVVAASLPYLVAAVSYS